MKSIFSRQCLLTGCGCGQFAITLNWPHAADPYGDWSIRTEASVPTEFNAVRGENTLWTKQLNESGQSGIVVWGDVYS